jgi:hypothetical protein
MVDDVLHPDFHNISSLFTILSFACKRGPSSTRFVRSSACFFSLLARPFIELLFQHPSGGREGDLFAAPRVGVKPHHLGVYADLGLYFEVERGNVQSVGDISVWAISVTAWPTSILPKAV